MGKIWDQKKYAALAAAAVAEGVVLLKNDDDALPLREGDKIAIFGRSQFNYYKSGTGSGGSVNVDYVVGIYEALENDGRFAINRQVREAYEAWIAEHPFDAGQGWASEPWYQEEMPLDAVLVDAAARESDAAIVLIGRTAGEDQDNRNEEGSYLLTQQERSMIRAVTSAFKRTIVLLNVGNIIDMKWVQEYNPSAVMYVWQGGQEGGNGVLKVLSGDVSPSGRLPDTIAYDLEDYASTANFGSAAENVQQEDIYVGYRYFETFARDKVLYPFGYGLSYTQFGIGTVSFSLPADTPGTVMVTVRVTNTGCRPGKETVQVYVSAPQGKLGKPSRVLCGFAKTKELQPGEGQVLLIAADDMLTASYDDSGVTGHKSAYVMEEGTYTYFVGTDVRSAVPAGSRYLAQLVVLKQCAEAMAPVRAFKRIRPDAGQGPASARLSDGNYGVEYEEVPLQTEKPSERRHRNLPEDIPYTGDKGWKLRDVAEKRISMEDFIAQISDEDLCAIIRGEGMSSPKVTPGIAGAFGGVTQTLSHLGLPVAGCSDGPSGIRMDCGTHAFSIPNGTCLASTFNEELCEELYRWEGLELRRNRIDALLGPGMNIHRNPLNGRNFEYFSEDPLLTGKLAAAQLRGMHAYGVTGVIKHFAGNTQEFKRHSMNSVISERALREIYLKGFELAVREGGARAVMSTYGPVNGIWTSSHYDLLTVILRGEWGFDGIVMTDWWSKGNDAAGEPGTLKNVAAQVRAQNDLNMVNSNAGENSSQDNLNESLADGLLTRGELQRSAMNICRFLLTTPAYQRSIGCETQLDKELAASMSEEDISLSNAIAVNAPGDADVTLDASAIDTKKGKTTVFTICQGTRALYELELEIRAVSGNPLAQIPVTVFQDKEIARTITLNGTDSEWRTERVMLRGAFMANFFLKFYFSQTGLEIRSARLVMKENIEEKIRRMLKEREKQSEG